MEHCTVCVAQLDSQYIVCFLCDLCSKTGLLTVATHTYFPNKKMKLVSLAINNNTPNKTNSGAFW